jgi:carboxypeptidase Taq
MMPKGAAYQRGEEMAAMEGVLHTRRIDPRLADWLERSVPQNDIEKAQLFHIQRSFERANKVPGDLSQALARITSVAQGIWAAARHDNKVADFLPVLSEVITLKQRESEALALGGDLYDALIDDYEPNASNATLSAMFNEMRPRLVALRNAVLGAAHQPVEISGSFVALDQLAIARQLASAFGYEWTRGRLDLAVHPFSSGSGSDVRITTRVVESDPFNCFYSTVHEVGHACYEQNINPAFALTPLGQGVSMGVHESQSRIYENQLGRSRAFTGWLFDLMKSRFGDFGIHDADVFYGTVNLVKQGYIRTEADEVQYNLHVMLRFDLERALIKGDLVAQDLEAAWNDRFLADFGFAVDCPANGMLQDVHWSCGLFGYFPTYSLGNLYAGCLSNAMAKDLPNLAASLAQGVTAPATDWLRERVQRHGKMFTPQEVITKACGKAPSAEPLLSYLETKFGSIYQL